MSWTGVVGGYVTNNLPIFSLSTSSYPKNFALQLYGDFELYDGTYYASIGMTGFVCFSHFHLFNYFCALIVFHQQIIFLVVFCLMIKEVNFINYLKSK